MRILALCHRTIPVLLILLFATSFCYADQKSVQAIGTSECADCLQKNIKHSDAFKGLKVSIDCKLANGEMKRRGEGKLDEEGKFRVDIPHDLVDGKKLKEECFAQLHSSSNLPCPAHDGLETTKLAFVSETNGKHTFSPVGKLKFSPATCTSEFLWPIFKHPWFKKPWFKKPYVIPKYKKPYYKPVYKKPITYTPSVPVYKKPYYKPVYKKPITYTPSEPLYKKPFFKTHIPKVFVHPKFKKWPFFPPKP